MTQEILAHGDDGDDRDRRAGGGGPGRALGIAVTLALLAVAGVAVARSRPDAEPPRARRTPSPSPSRGWTGYPPIDDAPTIGPAPDPFAEFVTVRRPPPGALKTVLLHEGLPAFLVPPEDPGPGDLPVAVGAIGGPGHDQVVLGWCAATRTFQDAEGKYFYDANGVGEPGHNGLPLFQVRPSPKDAANLDVGGQSGQPYTPGTHPVTDAGRCREPLYYPSLPRRADRVHDAVAGYRVVRGQYVATTQSRAFCAPRRPAGCAAEGWEEYGDTILPVHDLAGSYLWEGDFVVRGGQDGGLTAARLPGVRLVKREAVGVKVVAGLPMSVEDSGDGMVLRLNPLRHRDGHSADDSPAGPPAPVPPWAAEVLSDVRGGVRTYPLRKDVALHLGYGVTGLGQPHGTVATLRRWLAAPDTPKVLWLVLDARGRVLRAVAQG